MAWNGCPNRVKSTIVTEPSGPLGDSVGNVQVPSMRESVKIEV